jgi:hypothetical protein
MNKGGFSKTSSIICFHHVNSLWLTTEIFSHLLVDLTKLDKSLAEIYKRLICFAENDLDWKKKFVDKFSYENIVRCWVMTDGDTKIKDCLSKWEPPKKTVPKKIIVKSKSMPKNISGMLLPVYPTELPTESALSKYKKEFKTEFHLSAKKFKITNNLQPFLTQVFNKQFELLEKYLLPRVEGENNNSAGKKTIRKVKPRETQSTVSLTPKVTRLKTKAAAQRVEKQIKTANAAEKRAYETSKQRLIATEKVTSSKSANQTVKSVESSSETEANLKPAARAEKKDSSEDDDSEYDDGDGKGGEKRQIKTQIGTKGSSQKKHKGSSDNESDRKPPARNLKEEKRRGGVDDAKKTKKRNERTEENIVEEEPARKKQKVCVANHAFSIQSNSSDHELEFIEAEEKKYLQHAKNLRKMIGEDRVEFFKKLVHERFEKERRRKAQRDMELCDSR